MRTLALLFLLVGSAFPAVAGTVALPARVASYQAGLTTFSPASAKSFLEDGAAQDWLKSSTPGMLASSLLRAHEILDLRALPKHYEDEANLRRAFIARDSEPTAEKPAVLLAVYRGWNLPDDQALRVERALVEWRTISPDVRQWLRAEGHTPESWKELKVAQRAEAVVTALRALLLGGRPVAIDGQVYRDRLVGFASRASPYLSSHEDYRLDKLLENHAKLAAGLRRARAAARRAGDEALAAMLADAAREDMTTAEKAVEAARESAGGPAPAKIPDAVVRRIEERLPALIRGLTRGTPAAEVIDAALDRVIVAALDAAQGGYQVDLDRLVIGREHLDGFLAERGRTAEDLLDDDALLADFALEIAPIVVHETTHRRQALFARRAGLTTIDQASLYGQEDEREAFLVQRAFVKAFAAKNPSRAKALAKNERLNFIWNPGLIGKTIGVLHLGYSNVPSYYGSRARAATLARFRYLDAQRRKPKIEAALRHGARGRVDLPEVGARLRKLSATGLRALRRAASPAGELWLARRYLDYLEALEARIRAWEKRR